MSNERLVRRNAGPTLTDPSVSPGGNAGGSGRPAMEVAP